MNSSKQLQGDESNAPGPGQRGENLYTESQMEMRAMLGSALGSDL